MLVLVDGAKYEEFEYLKSVKGKLFDLFLMNQQFTQILQTPETRRRPLLVSARKFCKSSGLEVAMEVVVSYDIIQPDKRGLWFNATVDSEGPLVWMLGLRMNMVVPQKQMMMRS